MNLQLTDSQIRSVYRELYRRHGEVSGRALRAELRIRFGAVGKTERVFALWREERLLERTMMRPTPLVEGSAQELASRLATEQELSAANLKRAELAELREQAHQDYWALEIDQLRETLRAQAVEMKELLLLRRRVTELTIEVNQLRSQ